MVSQFPAKNLIDFAPTPKPSVIGFRLLADFAAAGLNEDAIFPPDRAGIPC